MTQQHNLLRVYIPCKFQIHKIKYILQLYNNISHIATNFEMTLRRGGSGFCLLLDFFSFFSFATCFCFLTDGFTFSELHCEVSLEALHNLEVRPFSSAAPWQLIPAMLSSALAANSASCSLADCTLVRFLFRSLRLGTCSPSVTRFANSDVPSVFTDPDALPSVFTSEDTVVDSVACVMCCRRSFGFSPSLKVRRLFAAVDSSLDSTKLSLARRFLPTTHKMWWHCLAVVITFWPIKVVTLHQVSLLVHG